LHENETQITEVITFSVLLTSAMFCLFCFLLLFFKLYKTNQIQKKKKRWELYFFL